LKWVILTAELIQNSFGLWFTQNPARVLDPLVGKPPRSR